MVPASEIAESLWPGSSASVEDNVRYLVHLLRKRVEPERPARGPSLTVVRNGGAYGLGPAVWIDAQEFEDAVQRGLRAFAAESYGVALAELAHALEMYRGDFLADEPYEDWVSAERERIRALAGDAIRVTADIHERRRDYRKALDYARWLATLERFDSDAQLQVITLCLRSGRRGEASRRYAGFRNRLLREFGEEPEFTLASLTEARQQSFH